MVAHKCTPLRNTVQHRPGAVAVERKAAAKERKAAAVVRRAAAGEQSGHRRAEWPQLIRAAAVERRVAAVER